MAFYIDNTKSAEDNFFALMVAQNPDAANLKGHVNMENFLFDATSKLSSVTIDPIEGQGYEEPVSVSWRRRRPVEAAGNQNKQDVLITANTAYTQQELIDKIVSYYGLVASDVVVKGWSTDEILYPQFEGDGATTQGYRILSKVDSLIYHDESNPYYGRFIFSDSSLIVDYRFEDDVRQTRVKTLKGTLHGIRTGAAAQARAGVVGNGWKPVATTNIDTGFKTPPMGLSVAMSINPRSLGNMTLFSDQPVGRPIQEARVVLGITATSFVVVIADGSNVHQVSDGLLHGLVVDTAAKIGFSLSQDGTAVKIYKDGTLLHTYNSSVTKPASPSASNMIIGNTADGSFLDATVDNFRLWNREILSGEFQKVADIAPTWDPTWNAASKGTNVVLTQNERHATTFGLHGVRGTTTAIAGKRMFEFIDTIGGGVDVGLSTGLAGVNVPAGKATYRAASGEFYIGNTPFAYGLPYGIGDVIGVCMDFDTTELTFYKNGISQGVARNLSAAGFNTTIVRPYLRASTSDTTPYGGLLNLGEDGFAFPVNGYKAWGRL